MNDIEKNEPFTDHEDGARMKLLEALVGTRRSLPDGQKEVAYKTIRQKTGLGTRQIKLRWKQLLNYAAIMAISLGLSYWGWSQFGNEKISTNEFAQVVAPAGQTAEVVLPDGSMVVLNASSKLTYPTTFNKKTRAVSIEGEAYFSVTTDKLKPFIVSTDVYDVRVTGTEFNLSAYQGEPYTTVLIEGEVYVDWEAAGKSVRLSPNQSAVWSPDDQELLIHEVKTDMYTNWQKGIIQFRDEKMESVARYMERWYHVNVVFENETAKELRINGALLKNKPVDQILAVMKMTGQIDYTIKYYEDQKTVITIK